MDCKYCKGRCIKAGFDKNGVQKFYCRSCRKYQQDIYSSAAYHPESSNRITMLLKEGMGLRGIARVLRISLKTIIERIKRVAKKLSRPFQFFGNRIYEMDEMWSYVGKKSNEVWIMYVLDRKTKEVIDFRVGSKICTDGLNIYKAIVPKQIHQVGLMNTRHIERHNLNIRTHLKRVSRKTICFSKSLDMLRACLKIYFWNRE